MAINTAIDMLRDDEPIEKIIKYSRLTEEQIRELASQMRLSQILCKLPVAM